MFGVVIATLLVMTAVGSYLVFRRRRLESPLLAPLERALSEALPAGRGSHLERPPRVRTVADTDDGLVPVIRVALEMADRPSQTLAVEFTAEVLAAIHPVLTDRDEQVAAYEVEFTFGPDGLLVDGECGRLTVPMELATRLVAEERYRPFHLKRDLDRLADEPDSDAALLAPCRARP